MKITKKLFSLACAFALCSCLLFGCTSGEKVTLGTYNATTQTFTALETGSAYSLKQDGKNLVLTGTIPHSASILGIAEGNIVAIRFMPASGVTPGGEEASVKTTNRQDASANGWNTYGEEVFEEDGSVIWVTGVSKENDVQIKIKWNASTPEVIYTLKVDPEAVLQ